MKKLSLLLFVCACFMHTISIAQTTGVKGKLVDSLEHRSVENTVVSLLQSKDSVLISFDRADKNGNFTLTAPDSLQSGVLMITHPYFADIIDSLPLISGQVRDLNIIKMLSKIKMLEEVVVSGNRAIYLKGDTTIFTADSFKVPEGANVEELLRRLPGVQVDRNGAITALGKKVERLLVDGEEFFGDDPGIATKNLRADNVKEVQVYEGKSEQAAFTGIDDGQSKQTINLKLKDDKKNGYFGKVELGGGLSSRKEDPDKFNNALMFNSFKGKRKMSGYGIMSNTGKLNLNWEDRDRYEGSPITMDVSATGETNFTWSGGDYNSADGIPTNWNLGLHYNNKYNEDKQSLNAGYKFVKINSPATTRTYERNFINDSAWSTNSIQNNFSTVMRHSLNTTLETKIDSMNTVRIMARGNLNESKSHYNFDAESLNPDSLLINKNHRHGTNNNTNSGFNASALWMHKFKKLYRTLSVNTGFSYNKSQGDGLLYSNLVFYKDGDSVGRRLIDQNTLIDNASMSVNSRISYTEPLLKDTYLELNYAFYNNNNTNDRQVFAKGPGGNYDTFVDSLSNDFLYKTLSNTPGVNFKINKKKYELTVGTNAGFTNLKQIDRTQNTERPYHFVNYNPRANFNYKIRPNENFRANYWGSSNAPSLNQLQPIRVNTDPLNIYIGNPDLKPSFSHRMSLSYNSFKMLKERYIWGYVSYNITQNAFTQFNEFRDSVRTYYTVNTNGISNLSADFSYNFKLAKPGIRLGMDAGMNKNRYVDFVTNRTRETFRNVTNRESYRLGFSVGKDKPDKYYLTFRPNASYNSSVATVNKEANAYYWAYGFNVWGNYQFPGDFEIGTDVNGSYREKDPRFPDQNNFTIWNARATKKFHKKEFELSLNVYDLLDENRGYDRNFDSYRFSETYRTTLRRFWLVSFIWNITKKGSAPTNP